MRERNENFKFNIGELTEEIRRQDLELVNGGNENDNKSTIACAAIAATSVLTAKSIDVTADLTEKLTKDRDCSHVLTATKECTCIIAH